MDGLQSLSMDDKISMDEHMSLHGSFKIDADDIFAGVLDAAAAAAVTTGTTGTGGTLGIMSLDRSGGTGHDAGEHHAHESMSTSLLSMSLDDESSSSLRGVMAAAAASVQFDGCEEEEAEASV
jgi:hypothetical protein